MAACVNGEDPVPTDNALGYGAVERTEDSAPASVEMADPKDKNSKSRRKINNLPIDNGGEEIVARMTRSATAALRAGQSSTSIDGPLAAKETKKVTTSTKTGKRSRGRIIAIYPPPPSMAMESEDGNSDNPSKKSNKITLKGQDSSGEKAKGIIVVKANGEATVAKQSEDGGSDDRLIKSNAITSKAQVRASSGKKAKETNTAKGNGGATVMGKSRSVAATKSTAGRKRKKREVLTEQSVNNMLKAHGVKNIKKVSKCLRAGILGRHVKLLPPEEDPEGWFGLDQVLLEDDCFLCDETLTCTVRDVLYQADFGGDCYETGGETATFHCPNKECPGIYVGGICYGEPFFDSGKSHNHCTNCPDFGYCLGDYRDICYHCDGPFPGRYRKRKWCDGCPDCSDDSEDF